MRPEKTPRRGRAARMAVRTYLRAHFGWLRGFPTGEGAETGLGWITIPRLGSGGKPSALRVNRDLLRQTEFAVNAAERRFPDALSQVVGDVDAWRRRNARQLQFIKAAVHTGRELPDLDTLLRVTGARRAVVARVSQLIGGWNALEPLIASLLWLHWHDEVGFAAALVAMERQPGSLAGLLRHLERGEALACAVQCVQLLTSDNATSFVAVLADRRCWEVPHTSGGFPQQIAKALKAFRSGWDIETDIPAQGLARPEPRLGHDLAEYVPMLAACSDEGRRRQLRLLEILLPTQRLSDWDAWWRLAMAIERDVRRLLNGGRSPLRQMEQQAIRELEVRAGAQSETPAPIRWADLHKLLHDICVTADPDAFEHLMECLPFTSGDAGRKSNIEVFLEGWAPAFRAPQRGWGVIARLLSAQRRFLELLVPMELQRQIWACRDVTRELIATWSGKGKPQRLIEPTLATLSLLVGNAQHWCKYNGPFADSTGWIALLGAGELTGDPVLAARLIEAAQPRMESLHGVPWIELLRLSGLEPDKFQVLAKGWRADRWDGALDKEITLLAKNPEIGSVMADALIDGDGKRLVRLIAQSSLNRSLGQSLDLDAGETSQPIDLSLYPGALHGTLIELARWTPNAARAADTILSQDFPTRDRLEAELAFLNNAAVEAAGDGKAALKARIGKLEQRLREPAAVSPQRLANHRAKLERRLRQARLSRWEQSLAMQLQRGLRTEVGVPIPEAWLQRDEFISLVTGFAGLNATCKKLAFRLLEARCGDAPWDLRSAPANQSFLGNLERRGVSSATWLDGIGAWKVTIGSKCLTLDLESDPLEIMRMGAPFRTCLAPGAFNFFSAVVNAADVNKRVLYARDAGGAIRGRCLLGLTDEGHIVAYFVYAHADYDVLNDAVTNYVLSLAEAMGTAVVGKGTIRPLLSSDWYDDGPLDLTGQLKFLEPGSVFLEALGDVRPDKLIAALQRALSGAPITPSIIYALSQAGAFQSRPELIVPLLPLMGDPAAWDAFSSIGIVSLLGRAGETAAALHLLQRAEAAAPSPRNENPWLHVQLADQFLALGLPHRALRLLQQSRPSWVKSWRQEGTERIMIAAAALRALHRPQQALNLYRIAQSNGARDAASSIDSLESQHGR